MDSRALMESAHASLNKKAVSKTIVHLRLLACRSDLSCHHFKLHSQQLLAAVTAWKRRLSCSSRTAMAGSLLAAMVNLIATGGIGSPEGPQRSEGAAKRLDAMPPVASPAW